MTVWLSVALAATLAKPLDAPVTAVTVYSDRARVTRTASVPAGTQHAELPLLLDNVDPSSLRVESSGTELKRVDIAHVAAEDFPADEARKLLAELEKAGDQRDQAFQERAAYAAVLETVRGLSPAAPVAEPLKPLPKLNAGGWPAALAFVEDWSSRMQTKRRELDEKLVVLNRQLETLQEKARAMGGARRRSGYRVSAELVGGGAAKLSVTYTVMGARWHPMYDLQLVPEKGRVEVAFYGDVSQETGEDWNGATLTLSTAIPATSTAFPKLLTWKIGQKDRFIPTPVARQEPIRPAPPASPEPAAAREQDVLRRRLLADASQEADKRQANLEEVPQDQPIQFDEGKNEREATGRVVAHDYLRRVPGAAAQAAPAPPPAPEPMVENKYVVNESSSLTSLLMIDREQKPEPPPTVMSLAPPGGYVAPRLGADLPASQAGGYSLSYDALRPETVLSGKSARVPLFSRSWPVDVERKLYPAVTPDAFLVAELKNPSPEPLPGGRANLFVGADPSGVAQLKLVSPQESFTLPLGIDRAVKPVRNVKVVDAEKGFIGKDDVSDYVVTIEVANPYDLPIRTRILDQWPVTDDKDVEVKLLETKPYAEQDKVKGSLEWRVPVPPHGKTTVAFTYSIRRPKGWLLHQ